MDGEELKEGLSNLSDTELTDKIARLKKSLFSNIGVRLQMEVKSIGQISNCRRMNQNGGNGSVPVRFDFEFYSFPLCLLLFDFAVPFLALCACRYFLARAFGACCEILVRITCYNTIIDQLLIYPMLYSQLYKTIAIKLQCVASAFWPIRLKKNTVCSIFLHFREV